MGREQYKTPDEEVTAEFDRVCRLFQLALGRPSDRAIFDALMGEASDQGMNWVEGLQYVIENRGAEGDPGGQKPAATGAMISSRANQDFCRAS